MSGEGRVIIGASIALSLLLRQWCYERGKVRRQRQKEQEEDGAAMRQIREYLAGKESRGS